MVLKFEVRVYSQNYPFKSNRLSKSTTMVKGQEQKEFETTKTQKLLLIPRMLVRAGVMSSHYTDVH